MSENGTNDKAEVNVTDPELPDKDLIEYLVTKLPLAARAAFGDPIREMLVLAISHERERCQWQLRCGVEYNQRLARQAEGQIQAAIVASGGRQPPQELVYKRRESIGAAKALFAAVKVIGNPPGGCLRCGGSKVVPSTVRGLGGQAGLLPCPSCCAPRGEESEPTAPEAPASTSSIVGPSGD